MDPPPPPFASSSSSSSPSPPPPSSSSASATMVIITVVGILAAFALLASYYAFVTKCQLLRAVWSRHPPWHRRARGPGGIGGGGRDEASSVSGRPSATEGLGLPLIRMLPVVKFTAAACDAGACGGTAPRISVSECAVCLCEFEERERVRLLPNCSHAFHIDCIDTWLQGSARCPFCRSDVSLPALPSARRALAATAVSAGLPMRRYDALAGDSIVIEVRGEHERWFSSHRTTTAGARPATAGALPAAEAGAAQQGGERGRRGHRHEKDDGRGVRGGAAVAAVPVPGRLLLRQAPLRVHPGAPRHVAKASARARSVRAFMIRADAMAVRSEHPAGCYLILAL